MSMLLQWYETCDHVWRTAIFNVQIFEWYKCPVYVLICHILVSIFHNYHTFCNIMIVLNICSPFFDTLIDAMLFHNSVNVLKFLMLDA